MRITSYTLKNGAKRYKIQGYLGVDQFTGDKVEVTRQGFSSKKDAQLHFLEEQRRFTGIQERGPLLPPIEFEELADKWFPVYELTVGESTYQKTLGYFKNYILPSLGDAYADQIDSPMISRAVHSWFKNTSKAPVMLTYVKRVLNFGVELGYLESNVSLEVKAPVKKVATRKKNEALNYLEKEELIEYLKAAKEHLDPMWYTYIRLLAMSGLRRAEALALSVEDIKGDSIEINKTLATGRGNRVYIGPPKTGNSFRSVNLDKETLDLLRELAKDTDGFLFRKPEGGLWSLSRPGHHMDKLSRIAGVPRITPHVLRHTHCAILFEAGAGLKEVQERLGHKTVKITLEIYDHVTAKRRTGAVDKLTSYLEV